jgi:hypothetical protein
VGGTVGGPIVRDSCFFFGAYQGRTPSDSRRQHRVRATDAMLRGDFTAFRVGGVQRRDAR